MNAAQQLIFKSLFRITIECNVVLYLANRKSEILRDHLPSAIQYIAMCLIKFGADQEKDLAVPNRPVKVEGTSASHSRHSLGGAQFRSPDDPGSHVRERALSSGSQAVIIEQLSFQGSTGQPHQSSYPTKDGLSPKAAASGSHRYQQDGLLKVSYDMSQGPQRKSGSLSHGRTPRQSNASFRTTRERIVVIDDTGRRREYYKRDDSGR